MRLRRWVSLRRAARNTPAWVHEAPEHRRSRRRRPRETVIAPSTPPGTSARERRPRRCLTGLVSLLLAGCASAPSTPAVTTSPTTPSPVPPSPSPTVAIDGPWQLEPAIRASVDPGLLAAVQLVPPADGTSLDRVDWVARAQDFAIVSAVPTNPDWAGSPYVILAWRDGLGWHAVGRSDSSAFCAALAKAPPSLISEVERAYFGECW